MGEEKAKEHMAFKDIHLDKLKKSPMKDNKRFMKRNYLTKDEIPTLLMIT